MTRPRILSRSLTSRQRLIYGAATTWFLAVSAAMLWPVYPLFSAARPLVLGVPLSLAYLVGLLVASFGVGLALYLWEDREGLLDGPPGRRDQEDAGAAPAREGVR